MFKFWRWCFIVTSMRFTEGLCSWRVDGFLAASKRNDVLIRVYRKFGCNGYTPPACGGRRLLCGPIYHSSVPQCTTQGRRCLFDRYAQGTGLDRRIEWRWCKDVALSWQDMRFVLRQVGQVSAGPTNSLPFYDACRSWWVARVGSVRSGGLAQNCGAASVLACFAARNKNPSSCLLASA
jgi:hypothetical protein